MPFPYIPSLITVHLGSPGQSAANVTVSFPNYIKNVCSSEVYPTWPQAALRANALCQISFALNRIYTEYYRSRGFDFDITNDTRFDQFYVDGRDIFDTVDAVVSDIFNRYIRRIGSVEPLFTQYCNGTTSTCDGLSQWGSYELAMRGFDSIQILKYYYGDDIEIVDNAEIRGISESYGGTPLMLGSQGNAVRSVQTKLNRISTNYPLIPKINPIVEVFTYETELAVIQFQKIFSLTPDGIVGRATWYKLQYAYSAVKRLNELTSEGLSYDDISKQYPRSYLAVGDTGDAVRLIQYYLSFIAQYENEIPPVIVDAIYGQATANAVRAFQRAHGLTIDGIVGEETYNVMFDVYIGMLNALPDSLFQNRARPYPGYVLIYGLEDVYVGYLQLYLSYISRTYPQIPTVTIDGVFGDETLAAVKAFQELFGLEASGIVNVVTWYRIGIVYDDLRAGLYVNPYQYPGYVIDRESGQ